MRPSPMTEEEEDPFVSIVRRCQPTSSQEDVLRTCPFARQSEVFPDDDEEESPSSEPFGIPVNTTGIIMVSPPESSRDDSTPRENFQTPPEDSLPASSNDQRPPAPDTDFRVGPQFDAVDGGESMAVGEGCSDAERAVDLGNDSGNLGFLGMKSTQVIEGIATASGVDGVAATDVSDCEFEKFMVLPRKSPIVCGDISSESVPLKKRKVSYTNLVGSKPPRARNGDDEPVITETNHDQNTSTEVINLEEEEIGEGLGKDTMNDKLTPKDNKVHSIAKGGSGWKNTVDLDKFRYVSSNGDNPRQKATGIGGWRELPFSISGRAKIAGGEMGPGTSAANNHILKDLLDALKMVAGELDGGSEDDVDFLETAKRRGMTLPRPRWWPEDRGYE